MAGAVLALSLAASPAATQSLPAWASPYASQAAPAVPRPGAPSEPAQTPEPVPAETPIGTESLTLMQPLELNEPSERGPETLTLKIATWHIDAEKLSTDGPKAPSPEVTATKVEPEAEPQKIWRHTFGSERKSAPWRRRAPAGFEADIIALQGVTDVRTVRGMFNARKYHLVASRQLLRRNAANPSGAAVIRENATPTTAVVFRRRRGIRPAGYRHFLPPAETRASAGAEPAAITAIRIAIYERMLWIASLDAPAECTTKTAGLACRPLRPMLAEFSEWAAGLSRGRNMLLLLGQWPAMLTANLPDSGPDAVQSAAIDTGARCAPRPSQAVLVVFGDPALPAGPFAHGRPAKGNACAGTAELTLKLH
ncbi:MAG: hypothetical protein KKB37_03980 [Alphaproteobacteria bacterium]|nr:hypothetical protein [Alphaproteobacteria bacterium]